MDEGDYVIVCENVDQALGWRGGSINIGGVLFCDDFMDGMIVSHYFQVDANGVVTRSGDVTPPPVTCDSDENSISINFQTGFYGSEVSWEIVSVNAFGEVSEEQLCYSGTPPFDNEVSIPASCCLSDGL